MDLETVKRIFRDNNVPITRDDAWTVQGSTMVVKHKALERLAAAFKLVWDAPIVVRAEREEAVIMARATRPDNGVAEWSFGEALVNVNYRVSGKQAAYVYAMAEKRAKDRVILKLTGLHGVYSEEEAEEKFAIENRTDHPAEQDRRSEATSGGEPFRQEERDRPAAGAGAGDSEVEIELKTKVDACQTFDEVTDLMLDEGTQAILEALGTARAEAIKTYGKMRLKALGWPARRGAGAQRQAEAA